jgi:hypothetical protein
MTNPFIKTNVICAQCGKVKGEANYWYMVIPGGVSGDLASLLYQVHAFESSFMVSPCGLPACGDECRAKLEAKLIERGNSERTTKRG